MADSAEPRLISELKNERTLTTGKRLPGLNIVGSIKGQGSVSAGISLMLSFDIIIDKESTNLIREFNNYSWINKTNKTVPEDRWNHGVDAARYFISQVLENPHRGKYYIY